MPRESTNSSRIKIMFRIFIVLFSAYVLIRRGTTEEQTQFITYKKSASDSSSVFDRLVKFYASQGIRFAEVPVTQSYWETGGYESTIYKENKNPFGMKFNRRGFAVQVNRGHAAYPSHIAALQDYAAWQKIRIAAFERKFHRIRTTEDYINMLDSLVINGKLYRYAEDTLYTKHIRNLLRELRNL